MKKSLLFLFFVLFSVASSAQLTNGIYRLMRHKQNNDSIRNYPWQIFKVINNKTCWQIEEVQYNPYRFRIRPVDFPTVIEHTPTSYVGEWMCDMINHNQYRYGDKITEYWELNANIDEKIDAMVKMVAGAYAKDAKGLVGTSWKLQSEDYDAYKVYGEKYFAKFYVNRDAKNNIARVQVYVQPVTYTSETTDMEDGVKCNLKYDSKEKLELSFDKGGSVTTEIWNSSILPQEVSSLFSYAETSTDGNK